MGSLTTERPPVSNDAEPLRSGGFQGTPRLLQDAHALLCEARRDFNQSQEQVAAMFRGFTALKQRMRAQQEALPVQGHQAALPPSQHQWVRVAHQLLSELSEVVQGAGRGTPAERPLGTAPAPRLQAQAQPAAGWEALGGGAACVLDTLPPKPAQPRPVVAEPDQASSAMPLPAAPLPAAPALAASPPAASASGLAPAPSVAPVSASALPSAASASALAPAASVASVSPGAFPSAVSGSSAALPHCAPGPVAQPSVALAGTLQAGASSAPVFAAPCIKPPQRTPLAEEQQSLVRAPPPAALTPRAQASPGTALLMMWRLRCLLARGLWAEMKRRIIRLPDHTLHSVVSSRDTFLSWLQWIAEPAQLLRMRR